MCVLATRTSAVRRHTANRGTRVRAPRVGVLCRSVQLHVPGKRESVSIVKFCFCQIVNDNFCVKLAPPPFRQTPSHPTFYVLLRFGCCCR